MRIGFDLDGVLCMTPFGRLAVHAPGSVPELPEEFERLYEEPRRALPPLVAIEYLRFGWRPLAQDAVAVLTELAVAHQLYVVTGRSGAGAAVVARWLRRHRLEGCFTGVRMAPPGLRPAQHKLATARILGIDAHIDDDPRTAFHLAKHDVPRVFLLDHAGAHGDAPLPERLTLVRSLRDFQEKLAGRTPG